MAVVTRATTRRAEGGTAVRLYILFPFVILSAALAFFAYRSYQLSVRMEGGVNELGILYLDYTAEIGARRGDAAVRNQMLRVAEEWQQFERTAGDPTPQALRRWIDRNSWIVSAIYVPDLDPSDSIYVSESPDAGPAEIRLRNEFYTASGMLRYQYDPKRLLDVVREALKEELSQRATQLREAAQFRQATQVTLVPTPGPTEFGNSGLTPAVVVQLAPPLDNYSVRASFESALLQPGWENHRVVSMWFAIIAAIVVALGTSFAMRGAQKEAEAIHLRQALIANVSHELRTPLSMIRLGAETLKRGEGKLSSKETGEIHDSILREAVHLSHLVENVLDVARLRKSSKPLVFAPVLPADLVYSVLENYESWIKSKGFELELDVDEMIDEQLWDRESISRALLNLIDNAVKYSLDDKHLRIELMDDGDWIALSVTDRGAGIKASEVQKIFDPYYRAEFSDTETRRGAGLGLTLVKQIVESHGGRIEVESIHRAGSTFRMLFPKRAETSEENDEDLLNLSAPHSDARV